MAKAHIPLLERAVHSLQHQTFPCEILVVYDGAGLEYESDGFRIIATGTQRGSAYARNLGLDHVKTPLVFFMDADDYLLPHALDTLFRAYMEYDTCYVYGDWFQFGKNGETTLYKAKTYNRERLLRHSLHLVNILIATDTAKSVYYDINYRGWEDWLFHIQLGLKGYCGERVAEPMVVYDMTTSLNREKHNAIQDEVYLEILNKYDDYLKGTTEFMACTTCGGNRGQIRPPINVMVVPPPPQNGFTILEYTGRHSAPVTFKVNGNHYKGANDDSFKFIHVLNEDVEGLLNIGPFRRAVKAKQTIEPAEAAKEFSEWRAVNQKPEPQDWTKIFKEGATAHLQDGEPEVLIANPATARKGRPKGSKNKVKSETVAD